MNQPVIPRLSSNIPNLIVWAVFAAITGISIINHDMWRDEWQAILLSYKSNSLTDLWYSTKDEGHPMLWFVILYFSKFIGHPAVTPKILQYLSALSYCGIILFYAPFPRIARYALVFTYFLLFQYAVITRDYGISILLIVSIMTLWETRQKHRWAFSLFLFLLAQSTFYATMMTCVFIFILLAEPILLYNKWQFNSKNLLFIITGTIGVIFSYLTCSRSHYPLGYTIGGLIPTLSTIYDSFIPIPIFTVHFLQSIHIDSRYLCALFSVVIFMGIVYFLRSDKRALLFFIAYVILHELFAYFYFLGHLWHSGYLFIAAIVAFWFYYLRKPKPAFKLFQNIIIGGVLAFQVFVALYFVQKEMREPYTEAAKTASWLQDNHLDHLPIYGNAIYITISISGYLDKPIIDVNNLKPYYAVPWGQISFPGTDSMLQVHFQQILSAQDSAILLVSYKSPFLNHIYLQEQLARLDGVSRGNIHLIPLKHFSNNNMSSEKFYIFLLKK